MSIKLRICKFILLFVLLIGNALGVSGQTFESFPNLLMANGNSSCPSPSVDAIVVSGISPASLGGTASLDSVCIDFTHTWDDDLDIELEAPDGTIVLLTSDNGSGGNNYTNTCFIMSASTSITAGNPPFTGDFIPEGDFADFDGINPNGTWLLRACDDDPGDDGGLFNRWSITFTSIGSTLQSSNDSTCVDALDSVIINVLSNDTVGSGCSGYDLTSLMVVSGPSNGIAVAHADSTITYTNTNGAATSDQFDYLICGVCGTINSSVQIGSNSDDSEEAVSTGTVNLTSSDLELVTDGSTIQYVGTRFQGIGIPQGATITNAYIQFTADAANSGATNITIQGHLVSNAPVLTTNNSDLSDRLASATSGSVGWNPPSWTSIGESGADQQTPNIASLLQEIVNQGSWVSGNAMAIIFSGTGEREAESYDGSPSGAPELFFSYQSSLCDTATVFISLPCVQLCDVVETIDSSICEGDGVTIGMTTYITTGTFVDTFDLGGGCDSIITLNLTVNLVDSIMLNDTICQGDSILVGLNMYGISGTFVDTLTNILGCDSIVILNLMVNESDTTILNETICLGDSISFGGNLIGSAGMYTDNFFNIFGCDSLVILILNVLDIPTPTTVDLVNTCPLTSVDLNDGVISLPTGGFLFTDTTLALVPDPSVAGQGVYLVFDTVSQGCISIPDTIHVDIAFCGGFVCDTVCDSTTAKLLTAQQVAGAGVYNWTLSTISGSGLAAITGDGNDSIFVDFTAVSAGSLVEICVDATVDVGCPAGIAICDTVFIEHCPDVSISKSIIGDPIPTGVKNQFSITYQIITVNNGTVNATYDLSDTLKYGMGATIDSSQVSFIGGSLSSTLNGTFDGQTDYVIVDDEMVEVGTSDTFEVKVFFTVDLNILTSSSADCNLDTGENGFTGLLNVAVIGDSVPVMIDTACIMAPLPMLDITKSVVSGPASDGTPNSFEITYRIIVDNVSAYKAFYDLSDTLRYGDGTVIQSLTASYENGDGLSGTSNLATFNGQTINSGNDQTVYLLVDDEMVLPGRSDTFLLVVGYNINGLLTDASSNCTIDAGEEGSGMYNVAVIFDGIPLDSSSICVEVPQPPVGVSKTISQGPDPTANANQYCLTYQIRAFNLGIQTATYTLIDSFNFGIGVDIDSVQASYVGGDGIDVLANNNLANFDGASDVLLIDNETVSGVNSAPFEDTFNIKVYFTVDLDVITSASADCDLNTGDPNSTGLRNMAILTDALGPDTSVACTAIPIPMVSLTKELSLGPSSVGVNQFDIKYNILVTNTGSVVAYYNLSDTLNFGLGAIVDTVWTMGGSSIDGVINAGFDGQSIYELLTSEPVQVGETDTMMIFVRFTADENTWTATNADCILDLGENGHTGLMNVAVVGEWVPSDEDTACVAIPCPTIFDTLDVTICMGDSVTIGTSVYTVSGSFEDTLVNVFGCDSIVTLNLTVGASFDNPGDTIVCDYYILPPITGTNLNGDERYYSESNFLGTQYFPGDTLSDSDTLYINGLPTEFNPLALGPKIWLDGSDINGDGSSFGLTGTSIPSGAWKDKSGNGNDPTYSLLTYDTIQGVQVPAAGGILFNNSAINTGTIFYVVQKDITGDVSSRSIQSTNGNFLWGHSGLYGDAIYMNGNPSHNNSFPASTTENLVPKIYVLEYYASNSLNYYGNGTLLLNDSSASPINGRTWGNNAFGAIDRDGDFYVKEFMEFDSVLNQEDRQLLETYLGDKWNIDEANTAYLIDSCLSEESFVVDIANDSVNLDTTICMGDSIQVGFSTYSTSGNFVDTLSNVLGCDSIIYTNLIVVPKFNVTWNKIICEGDSLTVGNSLYTISGTYVDTLLSVNSCDSIVTTILTVNQCEQCSFNNFAFMVNGSNSTWLTVDLVTGNIISTDDDNFDGHLNAAGYNQIDGKIWGALNGQAQIFSTEINTGGVWDVTVYPVTNLPASTYIDGDIDENGHLFIKAGGTRAVHVIDLTSGPPYSLDRTITLSIGTNLSDWAFGPLGNLYSVGDDGILYVINITTGVQTNLGASGLSSCSYGAQYFDGDGNFYVSCNSDGKIYKLDLANSPIIASEFDNTKTVLFSSSASGVSSNDGARCPTSKLKIDYGDAPDSYGTSLANNGPRHSTGLYYNDTTFTSNLMIGSLIDDELDGLPSPISDGDNTDITDDEDGVSLLSPIKLSTTTYEVEVLVSNDLAQTAFLYAWFDYDFDGEFDQNEMAVLLDGSLTLVGGKIPAMDTGTVILQWSGLDLSAFALDSAYFRIRFTTDSLDLVNDGSSQDDASIGPASNGEVEDYFLVVLPCFDIRDTLNTTICPGDSLVILGTTYTTGGTFFDTTITVNGCDSIITINLTVNPVAICVECSTVSVKAFLEGPYKTSTGNMATARLYQHHLLPGMDKNKSSAFSVRLKASHTPFGHPYAGAPWNYADTAFLGTEFGESSSPGAPAGVQPYDADVTDWILVTVRKDSLTPGANVWQCAAWLHRDGKVSFPDTCACLTVDTSSNYYLMVEHRNHFGVLSPQPVDELSGGDTLQWDFTTSDSYKPELRVGQKQMSDGVWTMYAANSDVVDYTTINSGDRTWWKTDQNDINYLYGDYNLNVIANSEDETIWKINQNLATGVVFY